MDSNLIVDKLVNLSTVICLKVPVPVCTTYILVKFTDWFLSIGTGTYILHVFEGSVRRRLSRATWCRSGSWRRPAPPAATPSIPATASSQRMWSLPSAANSAALSLSVRPPQLSGELVRLVMGDGGGGGSGGGEVWGKKKRNNRIAVVLIFFLILVYR